MKSQSRMFATIVCLTSLLVLFQNCGKSSEAPSTISDLGKIDSSLSLASLSMADQTHLEGKTAWLFVTSSEFVKDAKLKWFKSGVLLSETTQFSLSIPDAKLSDTGKYKVQLFDGVTNQLIAETEAQLTIIEDNSATPPIFNSQPESQKLIAGTNLLLSVNAIGSPEPSFQWHKNGVAIPEATDSTLLIENVDQSHSGSYTIVATNSAGSVTSSAAVIQIEVPTQPPVEEEETATEEEKPPEENTSGHYCKVPNSNIEIPLGVLVEDRCSFKQAHCLADFMVVGYKDVYSCTENGFEYVSSEKCVVFSRRLCRDVRRNNK